LKPDSRVFRERARMVKRGSRVGDDVTVSIVVVFELVTAVKPQ